jgi:deoxyribodipyrimidine photo-lyase
VTSSDGPVLVWFRRDLRLSDHPALAHAVDTGLDVIPVFILDDDDLEDWCPGAASRWWLHASLEALQRDLASLGSRLTLRRGQVHSVIASLVESTKASGVVWNRCYDPSTLERDATLKKSLHLAGCMAESFQGSVLFEPWEIRTGSDSPYRVFTPFWRACRQKSVAVSVEMPNQLRSVAGKLPGSDDLGSWNLQPSKPDWAGGLLETWQVGESAARERLVAFLDVAGISYKQDRDLPGIDGTSMLSPHLHFGEISPRQVWHAVEAQELNEGVETFLKEVGWREFCHQLLFHNPTLPDKNLKAEFDAMPWRDDPEGQARWQQGQTGYPLIDAGMRQLWQTGWMHNRVRMVVASFLTKHLLIDWRHGERWFWDTLVDADLASNSAGWQWVAGCGADAAPFFRIFNPMTQSRKFDASGAYIRTWVPELAALSDHEIHEPWSAPPAELLAAGVELGVTYPEPCVDHAAARQRALDAYKENVSSNKSG